MTLLAKIGEVTWLTVKENFARVIALNGLKIAVGSNRNDPWCIFIVWPEAFVPQKDEYWLIFVLHASIEYALLFYLTHSNISE